MYKHSQTQQCIFLRYWLLVSAIRPVTHYPHVTLAHIKLEFYFQLLPCPFPCVGCHMLVSIIW